MNISWFFTDLQVLNAELMAIHVDGREEDGLHLVVSELIGGQVGGDQHLSTKYTKHLSITNPIFSW